MQSSPGERWEDIAPGSIHKIPKKYLMKLLEMNQLIFSQLSDLDATLQLIANAATELLNAEKCTIWLKDDTGNNLCAKVFNGVVIEFDITDPIPSTRVIQASKPNTGDILVIPAHSGIVGHVLSTGKICYSNDVKTDPRHFKKIDESFGFTSNQMLTCPIFTAEQNGKKVTSGAIQLINKRDASSFNSQDQYIIELFANFAALSLNNCFLIRSLEKQKARANLSMELLHQVWSTDSKELKWVMQEGPQELVEIVKQADRLDFNSRSQISGDYSEWFILQLYDGCNIFPGVDRLKLAQFVILAQKGYHNDVPYHNWRHAISAVQAVYSFEKSFGLKEKYLPTLFVDILLLSMLTHDIDHRGTNNAHQRIAKTDISALYSSESSLLEQHHLSQTVCLVNKVGLLNHMENSEYQKAMTLMRFVILQTDLARYFTMKPKIQQIQQYDKNNEDHQMALLALLVTASDLNEAFKAFSSSSEVASQVFEEFFRQGDLERQFGREPAEIFDRNKANIPEQQVSFLKGVALPVYESLARIVPEAATTAEKCRSNIDEWMKLVPATSS